MNQLKLRTSGNLLIILEESIVEYTSSNEKSKTGRCQHVTIVSFAEHYYGYE
jgi:hypothetical protein